MNRVNEKITWSSTRRFHEMWILVDPFRVRSFLASQGCNFHRAVRNTLPTSTHVPAAIFEHVVGPEPPSFSSF